MNEGRGGKIKQTRAQSCRVDGNIGVLARDKGVEVFIAWVFRQSQRQGS